MKNQMKLLIIILMVMLASESFAQTFGIKAGMNLSTVHTPYNYLHMRAGFHLGATAEFPVTDDFFFETGLFLSTKGFGFAKYPESDFDVFVNNSVNLTYIDIPITAKATYDLGGAKIYGVFGPYIGVGLSGKIKTEVTIQGEKTEAYDDVNVKWGSGDDDTYKRMDMGFTIGAGVEIKAIQIGLTYGLGLANILPDSYGYNTNQVLGISMGYKFGPKK